MNTKGGQPGNAQERELSYCDNCDQACEEPRGNPDIAQFCCLCSTFPDEREELCATCRQRSNP